MYAATADQFAARIRHELWWLNTMRWMMHPDREQELRWRLLRWVLAPITFLLSLIYAQALPFFIERTVRTILPQLPWVTERKLLARIENLFRLFYELLRELGPRSLAKTKVACWLEELDEQLDSLEFVREYGADLNATIAEVRSHHTQHNHG